LRDLTHSLETFNLITGLGRKITIREEDMTTTNDKLVKVKEITGIHDLERASPQDVEKINKLGAQGELDIEQMQLLVAAIPHFVELQKAAIQALQDTVAAVRDVQKESIGSVSRSLDSASRILEQLASGVQTDEARMQMAGHAIEIGRLGLEVAKIIESMNKDNNSTWKYITAGIAFVVAVIGGLVFGMRRGASNNA
jgi:hypothetical protein